MALNNSELKFLEKAKSYWRPFTAYICALCIALIIFTVCFSVLKDTTNLGDALAFFMAAIPSLAGLLSAMAVGRSWEKRNGQDKYSEPNDEEGIPVKDPDTGVYITKEEEGI